MKNRKVIIILGIIIATMILAFIIIKVRSGKEDISEKIKKLKENAIIEVSEWYGEANVPHTKGIIVTDNKEIYEYLSSVDSKDYLSKKKSLSEEQYKEVTMFIENEIINKTYEEKKIIDASFDVIINYNNVKKEIKNNKGNKDNPEVYDNAKAMLEKFLNDK